MVLYLSILFGSFPLSRFPIRYLHFTLIYLIFTPASLTTILSRVVLRAVVRIGGGSLVGVEAFLASYLFYAGASFNPPTQFLIPDPSLAPFTTGDWGVKLRGSSVSRILQPRFRFDRLPIPILSKGVCPFFMP